MLKKQWGGQEADSRRSLTESRYLLTLIFGAALVYQAAGVLPISPVEGDGLGIANGATQIARMGRAGIDLAYRHEVQSGTYALTILLHRLTAMAMFPLLSWLSALAAASFILVSAALLKRITAYPLAACGLVLLLFQEVYTSGYYANSTVIAASFAIAGLWVASFAGHSTGILLVSGLLLGLGAWMRFDALLVAPAILLILHQGNWKQTIVRTAVVAAVTVLVATSAIYLSGSSIPQILSSASSHEASVTQTKADSTVSLVENTDIRSHATFHTPFLIVLALLGTLYLARKKEWIKLGIVLLGTLPLYIVYWGLITTPKYLYYLIPFEALLVVYGLVATGALLARNAFWGRSLATLLLILFTLQYIVGWQFTISSRPFLMDSFPSYFTLFSATDPVESVERVSLAVGAGSSLSTADGRRLLSGIVFAPLFHNHEKRLWNIEVQRFEAYLATQETKPLNLLTTQYRSLQLLRNLLSERGYDCWRDEAAPEQSFSHFACENEAQQEVNLTGQQISHLGREEADRIIDEMIAALDSSEIILISTSPRDQALLLERAKDSLEINNFAYAIELMPPQRK